MLGDVGDPQLVRFGPIKLAFHEIGRGDHLETFREPSTFRQAYKPGGAHQRADLVVTDDHAAGES